ncbi:uncharacterized protein At3g60930, chloroplastic-like [Eutrema salsugineum]|uniref:uncharacterized protein At3g60930, chloroplastic-like n=1 Tax=Eutrema salsugineum TaxID=72664 RepID=UPI000CED39C2|nr:uncharacterized protein At3g60930, chloroplastic-like [Eutrema salsugineum]
MAKFGVGPSKPRSSRKVKKKKPDPPVRDPLPPVPKDIAQTKEILAARKVNWTKHFSFGRVEKARALLAGAPVSSDSSTSSDDTIGRMVRLSIRDKKERADKEQASGAQENEMSTVEAKPTPSALNEHKGGLTRKRSSSEGDKEKEIAAPKKRRTILIDGEVAPSIVNDASASATLLSKINNKGVRLPPADLLIKAKSYASMSQRGTKLDARKDQRRIDEARKDAVTLLTKLDEAERKFSSAMAQAKARIKALETEKKTLKDECVKATDMAVRLEESRAKKDTDIASLQRQLTEKDALHEANIKRAVKSARRDLTEKMRGRLSSADDAKDSQLNLAQI